MQGFVSGKILVSKSKKWKAGDLFGANLPLSTFQILSKTQRENTVMWNLTSHLDEKNLSLGVGVLGMRAY